MVLIPASHPTNSSILPHGDVWRILDLVPHVSGREGQDEDNAEYAPDDSRLDQREEVIVCLIQCEGANKEDGGNDDEWDRVERAVYLEWLGGEGRDEIMETFC